ncbi:MAG: hypothetical protein PUG09_11030 [Prevotella sp.]|nr:hypothetical protein [Prevotella sp.]
MKTTKIIRVFLTLAAVLLFTSCLDHNLDSLDTYDGSDITSVVGVYHRYIDENEKIPASGEPTVNQKQLSLTKQTVNTANRTVDIEVKVPSNFPEAQKGKVTASNLVVILNISTAATIHPENGAAKLGAPGDWSKPNKYVVKAADGSSKEWTVTLTLK